MTFKFKKSFHFYFFLVFSFGIWKSLCGWVTESKEVQEGNIKKYLNKSLLNFEKLQDNMKQK